MADEPKYYLQMLVDIKGYKLRIGDYRAIIELNENDKIIIVLLVGHRSNIYKYANKMKFKVSGKYSTTS
ncbi:MAG: type II toxin-antitoxin system RelE/ParE family toxin [Candidatus Aenigmarchaeota archaeon]|nr:type II toxin-antitoxin system RelE/ParE family toxin [Candidatus Aenigmarchaeota archaeon]